MRIPISPEERLTVTLRYVYLDIPIITTNMNWTTG